MARILVADDDPDIREILEMLLSFSGHEVTAVSDGAEALRMLWDRPFDLALLDVGMPRASGLEVARTIKSTPQLSGVLVLMVSALSTRDDVLAGLDAGADEYAVKPFDTDELFSRVDRLLTGSEL